MPRHTVSINNPNTIIDNPKIAPTDSIIPAFSRRRRAHSLDYIIRHYTSMVNKPARGFPRAPYSNDTAPLRRPVTPPYDNRT